MLNACDWYGSERLYLVQKIENKNALRLKFFQNTTVHWDYDMYDHKCKNTPLEIILVSIKLHEESWPRKVGLKDFLGKVGFLTNF